ncbi:universal stress protein [Halalkalicoccus sp. NIPERK01]|uniref:universal stress protein n=1 Tax=Halalkalicoccus sp. NIPERK01 TaxID=3053469 RepID=UPI00256F5BC7|nr:universal stress protein [Halalkalicoccus sp. NIPERK01]MDL5362976.1 universal stress protein [Halalkalicoccus sp. NIPERK01]
MTVVAVVDRIGGDRVVSEAARIADDLDCDLHVVYVLGLSRFGALEISLAEWVGIPVATDVLRGVCARIADRIADPIVDEYEAVGLVGRPSEEILAYARRVGARRIVVDGDRLGWGDAPFQNTRRELEKGDVPVHPVS